MNLSFGAYLETIMKIIIAPDSYKESLTAMQVANAIEKGFKKMIPDADYIKLPMADGGEGTVQVAIPLGKEKCFPPVKAKVEAPR